MDQVLPKPAPTSDYARVAPASLWDQVLAIVREQIPPQAFNTWLQPTRQAELVDGELRVEVPSPVFKQWIEKTYGAQLLAALDKLGRTKVRLRLFYAEHPPVQVGPVVSDVVGRHDAEIEARTYRGRLEKFEANRSFDYTTFRVSSGLLTHEHLRAIGPALDLFLWCIDKQTGPNGLILGGKPVTLAQIAECVPSSERELRRRLERLEGHEYVTVQRRPHGMTLRVNNQKKFGPRRRGEGDQ